MFGNILNWLNTLCLSIRNNMPILCWTKYSDVHRSPDTWLVKAREPSMAKEWFTMRKDIYTLVGIDISMKSSTVVDICVLEHKVNFIGLSSFKQSCIRNFDPMILEGNITILGLCTVYLYVINLLTLKINEQVFIVESICKLKFNFIYASEEWLFTIQ